MKWDKLSNDDQQLMLKLAKEAQDEQRQLWKTYNDESLAKMKAGGVKFYDIDTQPYFKATQSVRDEFGKGHEDLMQQIADVQ